LPGVDGPNRGRKRKGIDGETIGGSLLEKRQTSWLGENSRAGSMKAELSGCRRASRKEVVVITAGKAPKEKRGRKKRARPNAFCCPSRAEGRRGIAVPSSIRRTVAQCTAVAGE